MTARSVTLIIPPSAFLLDERVFMHLGILKVAAVLERAGVPVDVLDLSGISNFEDVVRTYSQTHDGATFGITATTPQLPAATRVVAAIRRVPA
jgi:anaerobic magnesium-protoporphyrin IX monomethyl ester cyclase